MNYRCLCNRYHRMKHRGFYCSRCESTIQLRGYLPSIAGIFHGLIVKAIRLIDRYFPGFCAPVKSAWWLP